MICNYRVSVYIAGISHYTIYFVFLEEVSAADVVLKDTPAEPATPPAKREVPATPVSTPTAPTTASETSAAEEVKKEPEISSQEIEALEDVLEIIAEEKKIDIDQSSLNVLKDDVDDYKEVRIVPQLKTL